MARKILLVAVLLGAGVALAMFLRERVAPQTVASFTPDPNASADQRLAELERALASAIDRSRTLEGRIAGLEAQLGGQQGSATLAAATPEARGQRMAEMRERFGENGAVDPATRNQRMQERRLERLVAAGFTRERAEWIGRRQEELQVQAMQAQYDAQRGGRQGQPVEIERQLRTEMGDAEYERYLTAMGRATQVQVNEVLASSAAERAGLQVGDEIVSYAGKRVYDMRDLNSLTREGNAGESVAIEVKRNGQTLQVQVPRGVLGLAGGGRGPGNGGPPGGPGGFRGGPGG